MTFSISGLATDAVRALQAGGLDVYGNLPEVRISDGNGAPCRHCLKDIAAGEQYLVVAYRPFVTLQPYAETGPIFLHSRKCAQAKLAGQLPDILSSPDYIVRGYDASEQIVYGTGGVIATSVIPNRIAELLDNTSISFVHVRSARNNCFQCRVDRLN